jgi:hypothetical protein
MCHRSHAIERERAAMRLDDRARHQHADTHARMWCSLGCMSVGDGDARGFTSRATDSAISPPASSAWIASH